VNLVNAANKTLALGVPYIFKMRVETTAGQGGLYKLKVWPESESEPAEWELVAQEGSSDPANGSFLLVAHNTDASFGKVTVTPVRPITISNVQVKRGDTRATIKWITNLPAASIVAYGETEAYEKGKVSDNALITEHSLTLTGLTPGRFYHFQVTSADRSGTFANSTDLRFRTLIPSTIISDHFNSQNLNAAVWKFIDPVGDATLSTTGKEIAIAVPAGASHDIWTNENRAPRLMQPANNTDFEIEVKFVSEVSQGFQLLGVLVEESSTNFLRFDFHHTGSSTRIFAAAFANGIATTKINTTIRPVAPLYMRVKREDDRWTQSYSYDGTNWTASIDFVHALSVSAVGAFVGNAGSPPPAHTGRIDYFINTAAPAISNINVIMSSTSATITWTTDKPATSSVRYGLSLLYDGTVSDTTLVKQHRVQITGLLPATLYHFQITSVDASGNTAVSSDLTFTTLLTSVKTTDAAPARFELRQNYPNPFNRSTERSRRSPQTTIEFSLPTPGFATLKVFTATGEEVAMLLAENLAAGPHKTIWEASGLPNGVYFYRLSIAGSGKTAPLVATKKLLLVK
jgi:hypothetical protein